MRFLLTLLFLSRLFLSFAVSAADRAPALQRKVTVSVAKDEAKRLTQYQKLAAQAKSAQVALNSFLTEWGEECKPGRLAVLDGAGAIGCQAIPPTPEAPAKPASPKPEPPKPAKAPEKESSPK
jgi:hypothetical protein